MLHGIDVSEYQPASIIADTKPQLAIVQATNGETYTNPHFTRQIEDALNYSQAVIAYHFAQGKNHGVEMKHFLKTVAPYKGRIAYALDFEQPAVKRGGGWAYDSLTYLQHELGVRPFLYTYQAMLPQLRKVARHGYPLWIATRNGARGYMDVPKKTFDGWASVINQYTDVGRIPGYGGNLDLNCYDADADTFKRYYVPWSEKVVKEPAPKVVSIPDKVIEIALKTSDGETVTFKVT